ncbi:plexin-A4-like, partial [Ruditapes philippinarum]|uniref:plexin-A4-like n=1 Tax=Ruditapes philippinarum TaxID=129788 RepID=UPI00295A7DB0
ICFTYLLSILYLQVHLYSSTNCSEFKTCKETIKGRNPLCGWCFFGKKATRKSKCTGSNDPNNWLSSLGECVKLRVEPAGTKVNTEISITVTASDNIPKNRTGDTYDCVFLGSSFMKSTRARRNGNVFTCRTPNVSSHDINAKLEIRVTPSNVKLAETDFLFYQCNTFKT